MDEQNKISSEENVKRVTFIDEQVNDKKFDMQNKNYQQNSSSINQNQNLISSEDHFQKNDIENNDVLRVRSEAIKVQRKSQNQNAFDKFQMKETNIRDYFNNSSQINFKKNQSKFVRFLIKIKYKFLKMLFFLYSSFYFLLVINIFTFYAIFGDYIRIMLFWKSGDIFFNLLVILCIGVFVLEIIVYFFVETKYFNGFYFYLDLITTVFLIFDITYVSDKLFYQNSETSLTSQLTLEFGKIVRIIRLIRVLKLFKINDQQKNKQKKIDQKVHKEKQESKITKKLKALNVKRLILLILIILIVVSILDVQIWTSQNQYKIKPKVEFLIPNFIKYKDKQDQHLEILKDRFETQNRNLVLLKIKDIFEYESNEYEKIRKSEQFEMRSKFSFENKLYEAIIVYSERKIKVIQALLNFINQIFICILLLFSIYSLNSNLSILILNPLERMIQKIRMVTENPLQALKNNHIIDKQDEMNETILIEKSINKISELLVLGFGQAGCGIITHFLFDPEKDFDQVIPGNKIQAIFGFCDIRNFTDVTEILLEDIMVFVNTIAELVHNSVDTYGGAANKNIGDAFLLVWKLYKNEPNQESSQEQINSPRSIRNFYINRQLAELSLMSFIDIIIKVNTYPQILQYSKNAKLIDQMPGYKVKMGFGLHVGWAIEGAIGSSFKIDASYLSPNVNMSAFLEGATKQYKKLILFTGELYDMFFTSHLIECSRHLDTIITQGSAKPIRLYTVDLDPSILQPIDKLAREEDEIKISPLNLEIRNSIKSRLGLRIKPQSCEQNSYLKKINLKKLQTYEDQEFIQKSLKKKNFQNIFQITNSEFRKFKTVFGFGLEAYLNGNWSGASKFLTKALEMDFDDGATEIIYNYIKKHNFVVPEDWKHARDFSEK